MASTTIRPRTLAAAAAALALAALSPARAGAADVEAGFFAGYHHFAPDARFARFDRDPRSTSLVPAPTFGFRLAVFPLRALGAELEFASTKTTSEDEKGWVTAVFVRGSVVASIAFGRFRPFLLAGAGTSTSLTPRYLREETIVSPLAGLGLKFDAGKKWGLRVDGKVLPEASAERSGFTVGWSAVAGVYGNLPWEPDPPTEFDVDGDGIADEKDECPKEAGDIAAGGCPAEPAAGPSESEKEEAPAPKPPTPAPAPTTPAPAPAPTGPAPPAPKVTP